MPAPSTEVFYTATQNCIVEHLISLRNIHFSLGYNSLSMPVQNFNKPLLSTDPTQGTEYMNEDQIKIRNIWPVYHVHKASIPSYILHFNSKWNQIW